MEKLKFSELGSFEKSPFITTNSVNGVSYFTNNTTSGKDYYKMVNYLVENSPTTAACVDILGMLSYGRGINFDKIKENKSLYDFLTDESSVNINDTLRRIFLDYIKYHGFSILVKVDNKGKIIALQYINFNGVRVTKIDDLNRPTEYAFSNDWNLEKDSRLRRTITILPYNENSKDKDATYIYVYRNVDSFLGDIYPTPYWTSCFDRSNFEIISGYHEGTLYNNGIDGKVIVTRNYTSSIPIKVGTVYNSVTGENEDVMKESIVLEMESLAEAFTSIDGSSSSILTSASMNNIDNGTSVKPIDVYKTEGVDKDLIKNTKDSSAKDICKAFGVPMDLVEPQSSTGLSSSSDYINELYTRLQNTKVNSIQQIVLSKLQKLIDNCKYSKNEELIIDLFVDTNKDKIKATSDISTTSDISNNNDNNNNNTGGL